QQIGTLKTVAYVHEMITNYSQSDVRETGLTTDLAIVNGEFPDEKGSLFFTVQNDDGDMRLTRHGNFTVDGKGGLVINQGYYVLDQNGDPIETNGMELIVSPDGILQVEGQNIQLGMAYFADANSLVKEGDNLFAGEADDLPAN